MDSIKIVTMFFTGRPMPFNSCRLRVSAPSNRMIATDNEMNGNNMSPNKALGSIRCKVGPSTMPDNNKKRIAGNFTFCDSHWHKKPISPIRPSVKRWDIDDDVPKLNMKWMSWVCHKSSLPTWKVALAFTRQHGIWFHYSKISTDDQTFNKFKRLMACYRNS